MYIEQVNLHVNEEELSDFIVCLTWYLFKLVLRIPYHRFY